MDVYSSSDNNEPVTWVRGYPIYAAHLIVVVLTVAMILTTVFMRVQGGALLAWLPFNSVAVWRGEIWRIASYGLYQEPGIRFVIDMLMIVWFGREVEKTLGRNRFLGFYASVYLLPTIFFSAVGSWWPTFFAGQTGAFPIFIAFATLFPGVPLFLNVLAQWAALILVGIYTLMYVGRGQTSDLLFLWITSAFAFAFVRYQQGRLTLPKFRFPAPKPKLRVLPDLPAKSAPKKVVPSKETRATGTTSMAEIDALLDKIATSGIASLTPKERAKLDAARNDLLKRESGRG
jgi:membrane associated rhomboid family serine protease